MNLLSSEKLMIVLIILVIMMIAAFIVDAIQKTRVKKQDTQWAKDYKPLFDNLDKKESKNSSAKRIEYIKSLPYLEDCLKKKEKDLQERPYEESPIETLVLRIMGK